MKTAAFAVLASLVLPQPLLAADNARSNDLPQTVLEGFSGRGYEILTTKGWNVFRLRLVHLKL